ncbi:MAG: peptide chain release factor N(5)-glutamine methyltransferase [Armatimonadota bacterium]|nr:peptide chain release factor N(5)-glutamine methyltransferase [Armatimonadota bacterium]
MQIPHRQPTTVAQLCASGAQRLTSAGIQTPLLDAQLILAYVLACSRLEIMAHPERQVSEPEEQRFEELLARRVAREPLAYIVGTKEFYGLEIEVCAGVFVPRPETELLVDECVARLRGKQCVIADVGTGTGAVAVALALALPKSTVYAVDVCPLAVKTAERNVHRHGLQDRVFVVSSNLFESFGGDSLDAVVSNPPYVPTGDIPLLQPEVAVYEPRQALDGGVDGLDVYKELVPAAFRVIKPGGFLAVEVGSGQADSVVQIIERSGYTKVEKRKDLSGIERVVVGSKC